MKVAKVPTDAKRQEMRERPEKQHPIVCQEWNHVLFIHWPYPETEIIQELLPEGLHVDTFNGVAYISVIPMIIEKARFMRMPGMAPSLNIKELRMRTYVYDNEGQPGVWYISMDTNSLLSLNPGKRLFKMPYHRATMRADFGRDDASVDFLSLRKKASDDYILRYTYEPQGVTYSAEPDSLEFFLIERHLTFSYSHREKQLYRSRVFHEPYALQNSLVSEYDNHIFELNDLKRPEADPINPSYTEAIKIEIYRPEKVV